MNNLAGRGVCILGVLLFGACAQEIRSDDEDGGTSTADETEAAVTTQAGGLWAPCRPSWPVADGIGTTIKEPPAGSFTTGCQSGLECIAAPGTTGVCTRLCDTTTVRRCGGPLPAITYTSNPEGRAVCAAVGGTCRSRLVTRTCFMNQLAVYAHDCEP